MDYNDKDNDFNSSFQYIVVLDIMEYVRILNDKKNKHIFDWIVGNYIVRVKHLGTNYYYRATNNGGYADTGNVKFRQSDWQNLCPYG